MLRQVVNKAIRSRIHIPKQSDTWQNIPKEKVECVIIGAGIVGLAVARELSLKGKDVLVLDSAPTFGTATSSRNSEVIHAGIYYPPDSLKARFCVRGRNLLYRYCSQRGIPHDRIGKLIVATGASEIPKLNQLFDRGIRNGVLNLRILDGSDAIKMEPELHCVKALLSPDSGIVDSHSLMLSLVDMGLRVCHDQLTGKALLASLGRQHPELWEVRLRAKKSCWTIGRSKQGQCRVILTMPTSAGRDRGEAETNGATFSYNTAVIGGHIEGNQMALHVCETRTLGNWDGNSPLKPELLLVPKFVVNSTGLSAPALAKRFDGFNTANIPPAYYARGSYFTLSNSNSNRHPPFKHLIYPIPEEGGLGVHVTLDLDGQVKFGPDVEWIHHHVPDTTNFLNRFNYVVSAERGARFYPEIRKYYPNLKDGSLIPGYAGIRPKLHGPGQSACDFVIQGEDIHGVSGLVNLFGIESPGLTSSMAIAEYVSAILSGGGWRSTIQSQQAA